jgi:hypothetical protein
MVELSGDVGEVAVDVAEGDLALALAAAAAQDGGLFWGNEYVICDVNICHKKPDRRSGIPACPVVDSRLSACLFAEMTLN